MSRDAKNQLARESDKAMWAAVYARRREAAELREQAQRLEEDADALERLLREPDAMEREAEFHREDAEVRALSEEDDHAVT